MVPSAADTSATRDGDRQHAVETVGEQIGGGARPDQHGDHQDDADRLQRGDDGQREQHQQPVMQHAHGQPDRARVVRVEAIEQQIAPLQQHDQQRAAGDDRGLDEIAPGHAEHVAE